MKKVSKAILIGLGVLLALGIALLVALNLYVQSPGTQARIEEELSKALRLPLKLTNTSVTPWSHLRITGISIPNGDANFLEAASFTAHYRLGPLFQRKLIITSVVVENPKVIWRQSPDGKWKLPEPAEAAAIAREENAATPPSATPAPVEEPATPKAEKPRKFEVVVQRFDIKQGAIELFDSARRPVAVLTGVDMSYSTFTTERVDGTVTIGKAVWADGVTVENIRTPFHYTSKEYALPELVATVGGGTLKGSYEAQTEDDGTVYKAVGSFAHVDLARLLPPAAGQEAVARGEINGQFDTQGDTRRPDKAEGRGQIDLRNGQFSQLELFQGIGAALGLRELSDLRVKDGHADVRLSGDKVYVERVQLNTADLQLTSKGIIRLDKRLNLETQLTVDDALVQQLPATVRDDFAVAENGRRTIDFTITGTTDKPKTNLLDKIIRETVNAQFGGLLGTLFGTDKKAEEEKKKKEEEERKKNEKKNEKDKDKDKKKKDKDKGAAAAPDAAQGSATPSVPVNPPNP